MVGLKVGVTTPCSSYLNAAQKSDSHSALLHPAYKVVKLAAPTSEFPRLEQIQLLSTSCPRTRSHSLAQLRCVNSALTLRLGPIGGGKLERSFPVTPSLHTEAQ